MSDPDYSQLIVYNLPFTFFTLLYGVYLVLFVTCMYIMAHKKGSVNRLHLTAIVALFVLATFGFIFGCIFTNLSIKIFAIGITVFKDVLLADISSVIMAGIYVLANIIADVILIHRCYKVWGAKKRIIIPPVLISIINNVLPFMIAGRIWWIENQVSKFLPSRKFNLPKHTIAICLESGIMYPLALLSALVSTFQPAEKPASQVHFVPILIQVVGIAPTFIILSIFN
ncbi:hypothetical protein K435DRAFT_796430 [Dendrothele bispora CBS 962.96]|uniref:Uncharacterized protein n=1 Tax=Dendrothele bispora (strain CBS 962.96) TaxID=1314807 RepID=A0A4S8M5P0_DENBC|nr:hypothetical protein K435DRAFT_796430 [Dendrothele bispora CBS 962.96]